MCELHEKEGGFNFCRRSNVVDYSLVGGSLGAHCPPSCLPSCPSKLHSFRPHLSIARLLAYLISGIGEAEMRRATAISSLLGICTFNPG
jgi:hypothetical protein